MIVRLTDTLVEQEQECLAGLRMTAHEFFEAAEKVPGFRYQLVDGVVVMSPSGTPIHQRVAMEIALQIGLFLREHPVGAVVTECDVQLEQGSLKGDIVYRPDVLFYRRDRLTELNERLIGPPDLVVEVLSPGTRRMDKGTKLFDYERLGVKEYWIIDPSRESMTFYRFQGGRFTEMEAHTKFVCK